MHKQKVETAGAPAAIGSYSQAIRVGDAVYLSGQIGLDPASGQLVAGGAKAEIRQIFTNLAAVAEAAGGGLADAVKVTAYLTDLAAYPDLNEIMGEFFPAPFPARAAVAVAALPRGARAEADVILVLGAAGR
ncbi:MAG TPA: Rid family detoxifying hydrolase [Nevskiaceae bacterium]